MGPVILTVRGSGTALVPLSLCARMRREARGGRGLRRVPRPPRVAAVWADRLSSPPGCRPIWPPCSGSVTPIAALRKSSRSKVLHSDARWLPRPERGRSRIRQAANSGGEAWQVAKPARPSIRLTSQWAQTPERAPSSPKPIIDQTKSCLPVPLNAAGVYRWIGAAARDCPQTSDTHRPCRLFQEYDRRSQGGA